MESWVGPKGMESWVGPKGMESWVGPKGMESWVGSKNVVFCSGYLCVYSFLKSTKKVFNVHGAWPSPKIVIHVYGHDFCIII